MKKAYNPKSIEPKWQRTWERNGHPKPKGTKGKSYILDMFPYPSGDGLHVGHVENYTATDIYARYMRFRGYDVLHPIGWDAFGLPAENFAIKTGVHPDKKTHQNIKNFTRQIKSLGISYDWDREIDTSSTGYYRWTQWMFLFLYKNGLAYKKKAKVNWCHSCQTVLANEQVAEGKCDRCGSVVVQKDLEQWFFRITDFVEDSRSKSGKKISGLLSGLEKIDWPSSTKAAQTHWIGRSEGAEAVFPIADTDEEIWVYTTRIDTIFSGTYLVLAPEHPIVTALLKIKNQKSKIKNIEEVRKYIEQTKKKTDLERTDLNKEKTGIALEGVLAINPATTEKIPVWVADFVLGHYGTGAVFADAHDKRDFDMAKKYGIPLKVSIKPADEELWKKAERLEECFDGDGILINSGQFDGLSSAEARPKITAWLAAQGMAKKQVNYKMRDWLISRQRYWGAPIPIIYCDVCGTVPVPEKDLPVKLPTDVDFRPTGESPLARSKSFQKATCPTCGSIARREADTMDTFVCSSWYYLRFADPKNTKRFADPKKLERYLPVDFYMGGAEHTVLHLLYARFFTKALAKYGYLGFDEPFVKLRHQGMVLAEDGRKMSKSLGNVVNPDEVVGELGADTLRLYEMFMGPLEDMKGWNMGSVIGLRRFLDKVWKLQEKVTKDGQSVAGDKKIQGLLHRTIKKVTDDIEEFKFNTAISAMMILVNEMERCPKLSVVEYQSLVLLLSPFAPHIAEELWHGMGNKKSVFLAAWPKYDARLLKSETANVAVQINGKLRAVLVVETGSDEETVKAMAFSDPKVMAHIGGKEIRKAIYVPDKILNLVVT
ncbi:MAG: leucine--tRNA ligase [Candidatus Moraniibacteriota bacterium]